MATPIKKALHFVRQYPWLVVALVHTIWTLLRLMADYGTPRPSFEIGMGHLLSLIAMVVVYTTAGWDLRKLRENR